MAGDPVSWLLIEPGWTVYDAAGDKVGKVKEVLADQQADIFHGLLVDDDEVLAERSRRRSGRPRSTRPPSDGRPKVCRRQRARQPFVYAAIRLDGDADRPAAPNGPQHAAKTTKRREPVRRRGRRVRRRAPCSRS